MRHLLNKFFFAAVCAAFAIASAPAVAGSIYTNNLITNYNFATDSFAGWDISNIYYSTGVYIPPDPLTGTCGEWDPSTGGCMASNTTTDPPGHDGVYSAQFGNLPSGPYPQYGEIGAAHLNQTVTTDPGGTYTVQFWMRPLDYYNVGNCPFYIDPFTPNNLLDVSFDGQPLLPLSGYGQAGPSSPLSPCIKPTDGSAWTWSASQLPWVGSSPTWNLYSYTVTVGSTGSSTLSFSSWDENDYLLVTDVAVCPGTCIEPPPPGTTPEPATVALLGAGLAMLVASRRRRTRSARTKWKGARQPD